MSLGTAGEGTERVWRRGKAERVVEILLWRSLFGKAVTGTSSPQVHRSSPRASPGRGVHTSLLEHQAVGVLQQKDIPDVSLSSRHLSECLS